MIPDDQEKAEEKQTFKMWLRKSKPNSNQIMWLLFWCGGVLFTSRMMFTNLSLYFVYRSHTNTKDDEKTPAFFPKIRVCHNSMHSKERLRLNYPKVDAKRIHNLYGLDMSEEMTKNSSSEYWKDVNNIDLGTFFKKTRPTYKMVICRIETYDCRKLWRLVKTSKGYCLELYIPTDNENRKPGQPPIEPEKDRTRKLRQLGFTIAYNKRDSTYGWNGYMNGLTVYFMERSSLFQEEKSSFPLIPTLTTIATLQNVKNTHLGHPYKKCIRESYKPNYSYNTCEYEKIIAGYQKCCDCVPSYLSDEISMNWINSTKPCSFFEHATCIAPLQTDPEHRDEMKANRCYPKCEYTSIEIKKLNHVELNSEHLNFVRDTVNLSKDIDLISTVISLNDEPTWVLRTEQADYKLSELLSDMGGSMSLILGLSLYNFVHLLVRIKRRLRRHFLRLIKPYKRVRQTKPKKMNNYPSCSKKVSKSATALLPNDSLYFSRSSSNQSHLKPSL